MSRPDKSKKKQRRPYIDDGHTIYDMSALTGKDSSDPSKQVGLSMKEKIAAILAAFQCYLPMLLIVLGSFLFVMLLITLWLSV